MSTRRVNRLRLTVVMLLLIGTGTVREEKLPRRRVAQLKAD